ncbi:MAG: ribosome biogenesis GTPase Der [Algisphaera sp.]
MPSKIVIVGRPNVGKSSLMNRLAGRRVSIVDPTAGVTRDRVATDAFIPAENPGDPPRPVELIDTGGYGVEDTLRLTADIERQIAEGLAEADLILFVIDARSGIMPLDRTVAHLLRTSDARHKPILLIANKVDAENLEAGAFEASELGLGDPIPVSAETRYRLNHLYEVLRKALPPIDPEDTEPLPREEYVKRRLRNDESGDVDPRTGLKIALVGKRNAGKSTLTNALAGSERVIVSEHPGTTRDSVDVRIDYSTPGELNAAGDPRQTRLTLIDTAGVRKTKSLDGDIEFYSQHRSLRSVRRADVCLLLIDAAVPISQVDHQLVNEIKKHHRPTVIVVNKWDIAEAQYTEEEYAEYLEDALKGLQFAPVVFISAEKQEGMEEVVRLAIDLHRQAHTRIGTGELNAFLDEVKLERGPRAGKGGKTPTIYYSTQHGVNPPAITVFVNDPGLFNNNYQQFLMNRIRDEMPFAEVPIDLVFKPRRRDDAADRYGGHQHKRIK